MFFLKTVIVITLLLVCPAWSVSTSCGEGEVRDLDGSCVTKFVLPKKKAVCPKLSIDNGEIFLIGSGRMVQFYCDTGYVRVPDTEVAICQVQGTWSKMVPVCLKPGCQVPPAPPSGSITTSFSTTLSVFTCLPGHTMSGPATLACVDGTHWNGSAPHCQDVRLAPDGSSSSATQNMIDLTTLMVLVSTGVYWR
eukprot:TRINITY_DN16326_c0_g1_i4.p1 TRINITY_DN16326_c0_g1~~TRINITY_DN16326_c0_g1_i4.p1  ORF type:complete len:193 (-),score=39.69 TRINITY_DN16326_c0_g1_i4:325-903(-)